MKHTSLAVEIKPENIPAIVSESRPGTTRKMVEEFGDGYFVIDEKSSLSRTLYSQLAFTVNYKFKHKNHDDLFREIVRR